MNSYKKLREIGEGAYGKAILVEHKTTKEKLVLKKVALTKTCKEEVRLLANLSHRNVVRYHDSFKEKRKLVIVMEYCDGGDLRDRIASRCRLTEDQIWSYFVQICLALKYLHTNKVLHRDLKPENIFLKTNGEVKLGDFGVSKSLTYTLEMAKTMAGTPVYLSPEVFDAKPYNSKSDIWALGCTLYEMAERRLPFSSPNIIGLCQQIIKYPHRPISTRYSAELRLLIDELLQKDSSRRPSTKEILQKSFVRMRAQQYVDDEEISDEDEEDVVEGFHKIPVDSMLLYRDRQRREKQAVDAGVSAGASGVNAGAEDDVILDSPLDSPTPNQHNVRSRPKELSRQRPASAPAKMFVKPLQPSQSPMLSGSSDFKKQRPSDLPTIPSSPCSSTSGSVTSAGSVTLSSTRVTPSGANKTLSGAKSADAMYDHSSRSQTISRVSTLAKQLKEQTICEEPSEASNGLDIANADLRELTIRENQSTASKSKMSAYHRRHAK